MTSVWILGASDPEMEMIERILRQRGSEIVYAVTCGRRVVPTEAYGPEVSVDLVGREYLADRHLHATAVECAPAIPATWTVEYIDHHRPGDRGYGQPPEEYWEASSLGQVCRRLGIEPDDEMRFVAAADHCLTAAYAGRCPGVDPALLDAYRVQQRAEWLARGPGEGRDVPRAAVAEIVGQHVADLDRGGVEAWRRAIRIARYETRQALAHAPTITLGGVDVRDVRALGTLPELPAVAAELGVPVLYRLTPQFVGLPNAKVGILGAGVGTPAGPAPVEAFLRGEGPAAELKRLYGDPVRGFAGGHEQE